jgi:hypothetical protein
MFTNIKVPSYAQEHNDPTLGSIVMTDKILDSDPDKQTNEAMKELRDIGDGLFRLSVYKDNGEQTDWDFEEFSDLEEARQVYDKITHYDDMLDRHSF